MPGDDVLLALPGVQHGPFGTPPVQPEAVASGSMRHSSKFQRLICQFVSDLRLRLDIRHR